MSAMRCVQATLQSICGKGKERHGKKQYIGCKVKFAKQKGVNTCIGSTTKEASTV